MEKCGVKKKPKKPKNNVRIATTTRHGVRVDCARNALKINDNDSRIHNEWKLDEEYRRIVTGYETGITMH